MSEGKPGLGAALQGFAAAHPQAGPPSSPAPDLQAAAGADLFELRQAETQANSVTRREGPGRPRGAINKRTDSLKRWILGLGYRHPAVVLAELASADVKELQKAIGLKGVDAANLKLRAAEALMPYFEQKLPTAIELPPNDGRPALIIDVEAADIRRAEGDVMRLDDALDEVYGEGEQNQALSGADGGRLGDDQSPGGWQVPVPDKETDG